LYEALRLRLLVVGVADAVVDPRTVVVHLEDTSPAVLAVVRSVRLELAAFSGSIRQHTSAYVSIRQHTSVVRSVRLELAAFSGRSVARRQASAQVLFSLF
jgi:hypothetical protein